MTLQSPCLIVKALVILRATDWLILLCVSAAVYVFMYRKAVLSQGNRVITPVIQPTSIPAGISGWIPLEQNGDLLSPGSEDSRLM